MPKSENMGTKSWLGGKNADALVFLAIGDLWGTILTRTVKMCSVQNSGMHVVLEVSISIHRCMTYLRVLCSRSSDVQLKGTVTSLKVWAI